MPVILAFCLPKKGGNSQLPLYLIRNFLRKGGGGGVRSVPQIPTLESYSFVIDFSPLSIHIQWLLYKSMPGLFMQSSLLR